MKLEERSYLVIEDNTIYEVDRNCLEGKQIISYENAENKVEPTVWDVGSRMATLIKKA